MRSPSNTSPPDDRAYSYVNANLLDADCLTTSEDVCMDVSGNETSLIRPIIVTVHREVAYLKGSL